MEQQQQQQTADDKMKLIYFDARGRCEHIRYLLAMGGIDYDDVRISKEEWTDLKPKTPYGTLPVIEVNGKMYGQSIALGRMIARQANLYGCGIQEQACVDSIVDTVTDMRETAISMFSGTEEEKAQKKEKFTESFAPASLSVLTKLLGEKKYFIGDKVSWADIHFYTVLEFLVTVGQMADILSPYPELKRLYDDVENLEAIAAWRNKRPVTEF